MMLMIRRLSCVVRWGGRWAVGGGRWAEDCAYAAPLSFFFSLCGRQALHQAIDQAAQREQRWREQGEQGDACGEGRERAQVSVISIIRDIGSVVIISIGVEVGHCPPGQVGGGRVSITSDPNPIPGACRDDTIALHLQARVGRATSRRCEKRCCGGGGGGGGCCCCWGM